MSIQINISYNQAVFAELKRFKMDLRVTNFSIKYITEILIQQFKIS